jgi:hypothetical protein
VTHDLSKELLQSDRVWEGTRYCIDKEVEPALRTRTGIDEPVLTFLPAARGEGMSYDQAA